jgi:hypothetical protein
MSEPAITPATDAPPDFAAFEASENRKAMGGEPEPELVKEPEPEPEPEAETPAEEPKAAPIEATGKDYTPPNSRSKRTAKDQEFINERIRTSVSEATKQLQAEIAELKAKVAPAAEPVTPEPVTDPKDPEPQEANFETYGAFTRELARWAIRQDRREAEAAAAAKAATERDAAADADITARMGEWIDRRNDFAAKHPGYYDKAGAYLDTLRAGTLFGDAILESEVGPQMALHLATHPDEVQRISALSLNSAIRALGRIEATYLTSASASAGPAAKTVTTAPAPPTTLAARSADSADRATAAVLRGDFSAFEAEENRKALQASR